MTNLNIKYKAVSIALERLHAHRHPFCANSSHSEIYNYPKFINQCPYAYNNMWA